ncbi:MAG: GntR family transcriptional regulator [Lachnospiraceae bacterium]|nr:GntR family transcriptional regulator [Lachnospiraceae bacterium]
MAWEFENDRPIYTQLLEKIQIMIISGQYKLGDRLPSVRDLAAEAAVNPNTMQRALTELERRGLVYSQRTSGRMITEDAQLVAKYKEQVAMEHIEIFIKTMEELGYTKKEIITMLNKNCN